MWQLHREELMATFTVEGAASDIRAEPSVWAMILTGFGELGFIVAGRAGPLVAGKWEAA